MSASGSDQPKTAGVLLAAGAGRRFGGPKALVEYRGQLLVERGVTTLRHGGCDPVLVVLGAASDTVRARADLSDASVLLNDAWPTGLGSSLRCALTALADTDADVAAVLLVDTPGITADATRRVLAHSGPTALVTATYHGRRGHPVVLGRTHWTGIAAQARGDVGARPYLRDHADHLVTVACEDIADAADVDYPQDLDELDV